MALHNACSVTRAAFTFASVSLLLTACDQWALLINSDGILSITVVSNGDASGRFRVRSRDSDGKSQIMDVPPSGKITLRAFEPGELELTLLAPEECRVAAPNPRTILTHADETMNVTFDVHC
jgi:hypothetical protein